MSTTKRALILVSLLLMTASAFLPVWHIDIWAPQYPEGLSMQISLYEMKGNIDQVNILNHYVGMKHIIPNEIPELKLVPQLYAFLIALGLFALWLNYKWAIQAWFVSVLLASIIGIMDLYFWGYDYGHNLNPSAPIKIPGMSFQPPLIGHKTILNIDSYSLPDTGGYLMAVAMSCIFLVLFWDILWQRMGQVGSIGERK